ncbi:MAG: sulfatase-like hydrolase/transferase [Bacteroidales bacterium]|jgi:uncharacterized sulfatase|nr:sulfatase-like hydrolase/transferase [Bacteroidales bacterium]
MKTFFIFIKKSFVEYSKYALWLFPIALFIRLFEVLLLYYSDRINFYHLLSLNVQGGVYDILVFSGWALMGFLIFALLYKWNKRVASWVIRILFAIMLSLSVSLVIFFVIAGLPLDSSVYSLKELFEIITSAGGAIGWTYLCVILFLAGYLFISSKKLPKTQYLSIIFLIIMLLGLLIPNVKKSSFVVMKDYYTIVNKENYWLQTILDETKPQQITSDEINKEEVLEFQRHFPELMFVNPQYPFLHQENTPARLSPFFHPAKEKPNIVIIIVEGLARTFCGKNAEYPSPTPYINTLAEEGLSWENCFATGEKTSTVLPALLGSLPYGTSGFLSYQKNAPDANTLTNILDNNKYTVSFFYGGKNYLDGMGDFLSKNGVVQFLTDEDSQDIEERNDLGIYDDKMFEIAMKKIDFSANKPRSEIYLTLTSHDPFDFPNENEYVTRYSEIIAESKYPATVSEKEMKALSSFLYVDAAVKKLIDRYRKKPGFEKTIFVITGSHHYDVSLEVAEGTRVPLIIWSQMLAKNGSFPAVVSHREFTPSLLAMLRQQYQLKTPEKVAWLNSGLDTCSHFVSNNIIPQMNKNGELTYFFHNNYFADADRQAAFINLYKKLDRYVMDRAMLLEPKQPVGEKITLLDHTEYESAKTYFTEKARVALTVYEESPDVYVLEGEFPLNFIERWLLLSSYNALYVEYEFDIKVEGTNRQLRMITEILGANGSRKYWSEDGIVKTGDFPADQWFHYEFRQTCNTKNYDFKTNDLFSVYLWDVEPGLKIYIKNPKVRLTVYKSL